MKKTKPKYLLVALRPHAAAIVRHRATLDGIGNGKAANQIIESTTKGKCKCSRKKRA